MTPEEREQLNALCKRVQEEKDPVKFGVCVHELNALLEAKERRIHEVWKQDPFVVKPLK